MVSIRYFCGVDEFCRMKSSPRGALVSKSDTGADAMTRAKQQIRMGIHARRSMTMVTSEPSQLAYRAQPVIAHNRNSERRGERGEPGSEARQTLRLLDKTHPVPLCSGDGKPLDSALGNRLLVIKSCFVLDNVLSGMTKPVE